MTNPHTNNSYNTVSSSPNNNINGIIAIVLH